MRQGARVFEVTLEPYGIETWVREDGGSISVNGQSRKRSFFEQPETQCHGVEGREPFLQGMYYPGAKKPISSHSFFS
jgi:hypothetical protein